MIILRKSAAIIPDLCRFLRAGEVIAAPTETAYGLLAEATNVKAVKQVARIKGREPGKPMALIAADLPMVRRYFLMSKNERLVARKFWPGPLTLLLRPRRQFSSAIQSRGLVGVRVPGNVWLRRLISAVARPLTATSANPAGGATAYTLSAVRRSLGSGGLKYMVDGGSLPLRATSTVVRVKEGQLEILRPGAISKLKLYKILKLKNNN